MTTLLLLLACSEYALDITTKDDDAGGPDETGGDPVDTGTTPPPEECNGVDDDGDGLVDEDFADTDADGRADCMEAECPPLDLAEAGPGVLDDACAGTGVPPVDDPWSYVLEWGFSHADVDYQSVSPPIVGNLDDDDGDGRVGPGDIPEVVITSAGGFQYALDGATGALKWRVPGAYAYTTPAIADANGDGEPELLVVDRRQGISSYDGQGQLLAQSSASAASVYSLSVADLEGDGLPEVILGNVIFDGATLELRAELTEPNYAGAYIYGAVGDVDGDGRQEIFRDGRLYAADGQLLWDAGVTSPTCSYPLLVQADADEQAEIVLVSDSYRVFDTDGTLLAEAAVILPHDFVGPPAAGDFDGDGETEVAFPVYYNGPFFVMELDGTETWRAPFPKQRTYGAGVTGFDFDGDGALEILYPADEDFYLYDGRTGATLLTYAQHESPTAMEFAVIADVDADGAAEIVMVSPRAERYQVSVLGHAGGGWPAAGPTWPQNDYAGTQIEDDGHVPAVPEATWLGPQTWRALAARPTTTALPDLVASITDVCVADCTYGPVAVGVRVANEGPVDVEAGTLIQLYALDDAGERLVAETRAAAVPAGTTLAGIQFDLAPGDVGARGFAVRIDPDAAVWECDEENNEGQWGDDACP